ncbi:hypothetical protein SSX86_033129, partial [Deinandra increscens subsp. villosa]
LGKTSDSTQGPLVNAIEISKYLKISDGSSDGAVAASLVYAYQSLDWAHEGGDPCFPVAWSWLECNLDNELKPLASNIRVADAGRSPRWLKRKKDRGGRLARHRCGCRISRQRGGLGKWRQ